jgi:tetratricopeptide (TPR) repeat protein
MLQDVIDALRRKDPGVVAIARAETAAEPNSADAHHLLGVALRDAGDRNGARASFDRAIELAPDESLYHFSRAMLAYSEGDVAAANRASAHALALDPNQLGAYVLRIQLAMESGDLVEAERQLHLADRVEPDHPQLLFAAGRIALAKGQIDRAIDLLGSAASARPQDAQVIATLGGAYLTGGHHAFAEQSLRKALVLDPTMIGLHRLLAECLLGQGRPEDAGHELAIYRASVPDDPLAAVMDAELHLHAGDAAAALSAFRAALVRAPRDLRVLKGTEQALNAIGDRATARSVWNELLQRDRTFDPSWISLLGVTDDPEEFDEVLRRWRAAMPDSASAILAQAQKDDGEGRAAEAEAGYDIVLASVPKQPLAVYGKAMYEMPRNPAAAIERLDGLIANAQKAHAKPALAARGRALDQLDRIDEAVADWQLAHIGLGSLPQPDLLDADKLQSLPLPAASASSEAAAVVMLWGPPGSGSERLAELLRFAPSRPLMLEHGELLPRLLRFPDDVVASATVVEVMPDLAGQLADEYAQMLKPRLAQGNHGIFDWLARWDARIVPVFRHALPGLRLIATLRDPRDLLLNWLAFGAPAGPVFADPVASATWLANQLEHLLFSRDALGLPVQIVDMDRFDADPAAAMQDIAVFADLPTAPDPQPASQRRATASKLPTLLPAGRWRAYRDELGAAFAVLTPLAERLGYPRE